ncbi:hypothetical protein WDW37_14365 [Bdellovibrionota bacterium FG-1]
MGIWKNGLGIAAVSLGLLMGLNAHAGVGTSGGGAVAVCRDAAGHIQSAELLDLYEGKVRFGMTIDQSATDPNQGFLRAVSRFVDQPYYGALIRESAKDVLERMVFLPPGVGLSPGVDLGNDYGVVIPDGCRLEYVGYYESDGTLKVAQPVYRALSATDRAAFVIHEAVYKIAREYLGQTDSSHSRKFTAALFAGNNSEGDLIHLAQEVFPIQEGDSLIVLPKNLSHSIEVIQTPQDSQVLIHYSLDCFADTKATELTPLESTDWVGKGKNKLTLNPTQQCRRIEFRLYAKEMGYHSVAYNFQVFYGGNLIDIGEVAANLSTYAHVIRFATNVQVPAIPTLP